MGLGSKKNKGFTFVETLLTVIIIGIIASVTAKVLIVGLDIYDLVVNRNETFHTARVAMERMQDEIIKIRTADIWSFSGTSFQFTDADGMLTSFARTSPPVNGKYEILRGVNHLAGNVTQLKFTYYKSDGTIAYYKSYIRRINIDFTIAIATGNGSIHLRSEVFPRNFMYTDFR